MKLNRIIANGLVASTNFIENLAVALAANENLARMLAGDLQFPTNEEAIAHIKREHAKYECIKITSMCYTSEFDIRVSYNYVVKRFVKDAKDGYYDSAATITDEHTIVKDFVRDSSYLVHP